MGVSRSVHVGFGFITIFNEPLQPVVNLMKSTRSALTGLPMKLEEPLRLAPAERNGECCH